MTGIPYFNPKDASPELLESISVGRDALVGEIVESLRRQGQERYAQHWLVHGPLGAGKSHLVALLYHRIRRELGDALLPLRLPEVEYLRVGSGAGGLMLSILRRLQVECRQQQLACPDWLAEETGRLQASTDPAQRYQQGRALVGDAAQELGRKLVVLVENLDEVLRRVKKKVEERRLREALQADGWVVLVATSPAASLELEDPGHAMYQMFRTRHLEPLETEQVEQLIHRLGQAAGETAGVERLAGSHGRVQLVRAITGGNPRLVIMLFDAVAGPAGAQQAYLGLRQMLDRQTKYFEGRLERLGIQEQEVLSAFCSAEENLSPSEVSAAVGIEVKQVSELVKRLVRAGVLEPSGTLRSRDNYYAVSDDLLRVWYQYRFGEGEGVIRRLVHFLELWYQQPELARAIEWARQQLESQEVSLLARDSLAGLIRHLELAQGGRALLPATVDWDSLAPSLAQALTLGQEGRLEEAVRECEAFVTGHAADDRPESRARIAAVRFVHAQMLRLLDRDREAVQQYQRLISSHSVGEGPEVRVVLAMAPCYIASIRLQEDPGEAMRLCESVLADFAGFADETGLAFSLATAKGLLGQASQALDRSDQAIRWYERLIADHARDPEPARRVVGEMTAALADLLRDSQQERAETLYQELLARPDLHPNVTAKATTGLVALHRGRGEEREARQLLEDLVARFQDHDDPVALVTVAAAAGRGGKRCTQLVMLRRAVQLVGLIPAERHVVERMLQSAEQWVETKAILDAYQAAAQSEVEAAVDACAAGVNLLPDSPMLHAILAWTLRRSGREAEGRVAWERFLRLCREQTAHAKEQDVADAAMRYLLAGLSRKAESIAQLRSDLAALQALPDADELHLTSLAPLRHVADYLEQLGSPPRGKLTPEQRAERVLARAPRELRAAIEAIVAQVLERSEEGEHASG